MTTLKQVKKYDKKILVAVNNLLPQLTPEPVRLSPRQFREILHDKNIFFMGVWDKRNLVGMGFIVFMLTPRAFRARLEDMVIDEKYRGKGLGSVLTRRLISEAKKRKARWIEFTSRKDRVATNRFYKKFGFKPRDTNVYRLSL